MAASHSDQLLAAKRELRQSMLARRARECGDEAGAALARFLPAEMPDGAVAGFWPLPGEIDLCPTLHALHEAGRDVLLPVTTGRSEALRFRRWSPGAALVAGRFGTSHPEGADAVPDVLLVPLLAFDRAGRRLGYGGGYYDRTLASLPGRPRIGISYACQEVPEVPAGPHDMRLDAVATEAGLIRCGAPA